MGRMLRAWAPLIELGATNLLIAQAAFREQRQAATLIKTLPPLTDAYIAGVEGRAQFRLSLVSSGTVRLLRSFLVLFGTQVEAVHIR